MRRREGVEQKEKEKYALNIRGIVWSWKQYISIQEAKTGGWRTAFLHEQWANRPCGLMYRTIFFFTNLCEPELAHRLQTSKMRRNSTSLDGCQHHDINIVTISVARRRWTAPLKSRRPCVKHFTTFYALLKHVSPKSDYFTPKGHFLRTRAIFLRTGARRGHFRCL